jgi:hypothetical protein
VRKLLVSMLPSASMPSVSMRAALASGSSAAVIPSALLSAHRPKAAMSAECVYGPVVGARKPLGSADAGWLGNGSAFGTHVQTQVTTGSKRVDGHAGSPPRGTPA